MTSVIYADILFFLNLFSDMVIIFLTGLFSGNVLKFARTVFSAFLGALFGTLVLCMDTYGTAAAIITLIFPALMCYAAFGRKRFSAFLHLIFYFYLSSVMLFGGMYAVISAFSMVFHSPYIGGKAIIIVLLIIAVALIYCLFSSLCKRGFDRKRDYVQAQVFDGIRTYDLSLLVDSGNFARDPFSQRPVVIIGENSLDKDLICAVCDLEKENNIYKDIRPRVIPLKTVSGTALLYAFIPKSMYITLGNKKYSTECIIAIDRRSNPFFGKDGIIPASLLGNL